MATRSAAVGFSSRPSRNSQNSHGLIRAPLRDAGKALWFDPERWVHKVINSDFARSTCDQIVPAGQQLWAASRITAAHACRTSHTHTHLPTMTAWQPWLSMRRRAS